jgi:hypothetical protein
MSFRVKKEYVGGDPGSDDDTEIVLVNGGGATMVLATVTWHNPNRLDKMVEELNAVAEKYGQKAHR